MDVRIQQWGNSQAIRLPAAVLRELSLGNGDVLSLAIEAGVISLKPARAKPRYRLEDLLAQCDFEAPEPADMAAWNAMEPVGREL